MASAIENLMLVHLKVSCSGRLCNLSSALTDHHHHFKHWWCEGKTRFCWFCVAHEQQSVLREETLQRLVLFYQTMQQPWSGFVELFKASLLLSFNCTISHVLHGKENKLYTPTNLTVLKSLFTSLIPKK